MGCDVASAPLMRKTSYKRLSMSHVGKSGSIYRSYRPHTGGNINWSCLLLCYQLLVAAIVPLDKMIINVGVHEGIIRVFCFT